MKIAFTDFPLVLECLQAFDLQLSQIAFNASSGNGRAVMPALRIPPIQQQRTSRPPRLMNRIKANVSILRIKKKGTIGAHVHSIPRHISKSTSETIRKRCGIKENP
jgi:hypothetical protein